MLQALPASLPGVTLLVAWVAMTARGHDRITGQPFASRSEVIAPDAMAATSHPLATQVALALMRDGGSAVDAAIAANAVLGLMEPTGGGLGGDLCALVWDAGEARLHGLNASGRAPGGLTLARLRDDGLARMPAYGPLTVTVPGAVDGWFELHQRFGRRDMSEVLAPVIDYARRGFPVSELIAWNWQLGAGLFAGCPNFDRTFTLDGRAPAKGEMFSNPALADTCERIAREGRDGFYRGRVAATIAGFIAEQGGYLSTDDFATHRSNWVDPVATGYRGHEVWQLPPSTQGIAVLQMLNLLERHDLASKGFGSAEHLHLLIEAKKLAWADRARYCVDPGFSDVPVEALISKAYAGERAALIDPRRAATDFAPGVPRPDQADTVYLATADPEGNMVSLMQSNFRGMGSGMVPPGLGFMLHNRGSGFSLDPAHPNALAPGKRPFHTLIPGFVTRDGKPLLSFGVMGGAMQPQGQVQVLLNLIDFQMNLQEAGDAPRVRHGASPGPNDPEPDEAGGDEILLESGFGDAVRRELLARGHRIGAIQHPAVESFGGYQAILRDHENGAWTGASEARKDGQAAGY